MMNPRIMEPAKITHAMRLARVSGLKYACITQQDLADGMAIAFELLRSETLRWTCFLADPDPMYNHTRITQIMSIRIVPSAAQPLATPPNHAERSGNQWAASCCPCKGDRRGKEEAHSCCIHGQSWSFSIGCELSMYLEL